MRIGIVADIHDSVGALRAALSRLRQERTEQVVTLGDAFESWRPGEPGAEVAGLLAQAGAVGVWGNHDVGLSFEISREVRDSGDRTLLEFAEGLQPQLVLEGCRFSHLEPWRDARRIEDLWTFEGVPDTVARAERCFEAVPERVMFLGHFHTWLAMRRSAGRVAWNGGIPLELQEGDRHLVVVAPVLRGWCALFDTQQCELTPIRCSVR
jgi:hypothetical protein